MLGSASSFEAEVAAHEPVRVEAGTKLHEQPHLHSPAVTMIDVALELEPLERRGSWVQLRFGGRIGWAFLGEIPLEARVDELPNELPPMPPPEAPPEPQEPTLEPLRPDADRLRQARALLENPGPPADTGLFELYSDVKSKRGRELCHSAARLLPESYAARYGLEPLREGRFAVVIFSREKNYRAFEEAVTELSDLDAAGHAGSGVAALVAGQRTTKETASLLIHELTHLLNRRSFLKTPPPWLEEGLANDLAYSKLDRAGRIEPATLGGRAFLSESVASNRDRIGRYAYSATYHVQGPAASLNLIKYATVREQLIPLEELLDLTWKEFVEPEGRELRYVQSAFLVRYLLDGRDADAFRRFLSDFQAGGSADGDSLVAAMGSDLEQLMADFREWVLAHPVGS